MPERLESTAMFDNNKILPMVVASLLIAGLMVLAKFLFFGNVVVVNPTPTPNPQPVVVASLATLLPNQESRVACGSYFLDLSTVLKEEVTSDTTGKKILNTVEDVLKASSLGMSVLQESTNQTGWSAINDPIKKRIFDVTGDADRSLYDKIGDETILSKMSAIYESIGNEILGKK